MHYPRRTRFRYGIILGSQNESALLAPVAETRIFKNQPNNTMKCRHECRWYQATTYLQVGSVLTAGLFSCSRHLERKHTNPELASRELQMWMPSTPLCISG